MSTGSTAHPYAKGWAFLCPGTSRPPLSDRCGKMRVNRTDQATHKGKQGP